MEDEGGGGLGDLTMGRKEPGFDSGEHGKYERWW